MNCEHEKRVTSNMSKHGIMAEVTVCSTCGDTLDYRPLRDVDTRGSFQGLPPEEALIQAKARVAKAEESGLAEEIREESGIVEALPEKEEVMGVQVLPEKEGSGQGGLYLNRTVHAVVMCEKHGGEVAACTTGERQAHTCHHSRWGELRTYAGPCACAACHKEVQKIL